MGISLKCRAKVSQRRRRMEVCKGSRDRKSSALLVACHEKSGKWTTEE